MKSYKEQMDLNSYLLEQDFEDYCRFAYEKIQSACEFLGIINDEDYESFKERCYTQLEADYLNSIEKTIH
mgnify:FL=1|jgi:hypothetical protein